MAEKPVQVKVGKDVPRCANCGMLCGPKAIKSGKLFFHAQSCFDEYSKRTGKKTKAEVCEFC